MDRTKAEDMQYHKGHLGMNTPPIVSRREWEAARQQLLVKEKSLTRARDALAAERRRMPWMAMEKKYEFDGPKGKVSLLDLFEGRRQLIPRSCWASLHAWHLVTSCRFRPIPEERGHHMPALIGRPRAEEPDHRHRRLLRACRKGPRGRGAAEQRDDLASADHSITSSASCCR